MASPAVALPNGLPDPPHSVDADMADAAQQQPSSASSTTSTSAPSSSSTKRKREESDQPNGFGDSVHQKPSTNGTTKNEAIANGTTPSKPTESEKDTIRNYLVVLERYVLCYPPLSHLPLALVASFSTVPAHLVVMILDTYAR